MDDGTCTNASLFTSFPKNIFPKSPLLMHCNPLGGTPWQRHVLGVLRAVEVLEHQREDEQREDSTRDEAPNHHNGQRLRGCS